jgi:hypothetical protein
VGFFVCVMMGRFGDEKDITAIRPIPIRLIQRQTLDTTCQKMHWSTSLYMILWDAVSGH